MKKRTRKKLPKKYNKNKQKNNQFKLFNILVLLTILIIIITGYFYTSINKDNNLKENLSSTETTKKTQKKQFKKHITYEDKIKELKIQYLVNNKKENIEPVKKQINSYKKFTFEEPMDKDMDNIEHIVNQIDIPTVLKIEDIKKERVIFKNKVLMKQKINDKRPKLVIIIDDVTTNKQIEQIKNIGHSVNMSFLPPTKIHKKSAKIAKNVKQYMIHLPLQASSTRYEEVKTLHITDSLITIDARIKKLKKLYPKAKYINNHTGSKFTANIIAMNRLLKVLKKYNFNFLDSRTTAKSVAKLSATKYGVKMFSRNIFLDNKKETKYIQKQLRRAMRISKKFGYAIAIGHPYSITFETLKKSKVLLKDFNLIYIEQL